MSNPIKTPGFLLQTYDLGESDRILVFYTQHEGKIRGVARAAKKSRKRFGAMLDWFHLVKVQYRTSRSSQSDLGRVDSLEMIRKSDQIIKHLNCYALGSYYLELTRELTSWHHPEPVIFDLLHFVITRLEQIACSCLADSQELENLSRFFEINLLDLLGFRPVLDQCIHCREEITLSEKQFLRFCILRGGVICSLCEKHEKAGLPLISKETLGLLKQTLLFQSQFDGQGEQEDHLLVPKFSSQANREAQKILGDFIGQHTQKKMRSLEFLKSIQVGFS